MRKDHNPLLLGVTMSDRTALQIIPDRRMTEWLETAIPAVADIKDVSHPCPHCGCSVRYALGVSEGDYKAMQQLLDIANRYLAEKGVLAQMLSEVMTRALIAKAKK